MTWHLKSYKWKYIRELINIEMPMLDGVYKKHKYINGGFFFNVEMSMHKQIFFSRCWTSFWKILQNSYIWFKDNSNEFQSSLGEPFIYFEGYPPKIPSKAICFLPEGYEGRRQSRCPTNVRKSRFPPGSSTTSFPLSQKKKNRNQIGDQKRACIHQPRSPKKAKAHLRLCARRRKSGKA